MRSTRTLVFAPHPNAHPPTGKRREGERRTIIIVVTDHNLLRFAILAHLAPEVLVESIEVVLQLAGIHLVLGIVGWVLVEIGEEDGLRVGGLDVFSRAAVAVAARANFVVEGAVDFVLLGAEDGGEVVGHGGLLLEGVREKIGGDEEGFSACGVGG